MEHCQHVSAFTDGHPFMQAKEKKPALSAAVGSNGVKRAQDVVVGPSLPGAGKRGKTVLQSLFHSDADVAGTQETFCCRSTSARGFVS